MTTSARTWEHRLHFNLIWARPNHSVAVYFCWNVIGPSCLCHLNSTDDTCLARSVVSKQTVFADIDTVICLSSGQWRFVAIWCQTKVYCVRFVFFPCYWSIGTIYLFRPPNFNCFLLAVTGVKGDPLRSKFVTECFSRQSSSYPTVCWWFKSHFSGKMKGLERRMRNRHERKWSDCESLACSLAPLCLLPLATTAQQMAFPLYDCKRPRCSQSTSTAVYPGSTVNSPPVCSSPSLMSDALFGFSQLYFGRCCSVQFSEEFNSVPPSPK